MNPKKTDKILKEVKEHFGDVHGYDSNELKFTELTGRDLNYEINERLKKAISLTQEQCVDDFSKKLKEKMFSIDPNGTSPDEFNSVDFSREIDKITKEMKDGK